MKKTVIAIVALLGCSMASASETLTFNDHVSYLDTRLNVVRFFLGSNPVMTAILDCGVFGQPKLHVYAGRRASYNVSKAVGARNLKFDKNAGGKEFCKKSETGFFNVDATHTLQFDIDGDTITTIRQ